MFYYNIVDNITKKNKLAVILKALIREEIIDDTLWYFEVLSNIQE